MDILYSQSRRSLDVRLASSLQPHALYQFPEARISELILGVVSTKMEATFTNHLDDREMVIELHGDFWGGAADLSVQGGPVIAQITRDAFSARELFSNSQTVSRTSSPLESPHQTRADTD